MSTTTTVTTLQRLDRRAIQAHLAELSAWLLPGAFYGVQHTWPQLYRSDGDGNFLGLFAGEQLISHCAWRAIDLRTSTGLHRVALLGSVATAPEARGHGHAAQLLQTALADCRAAGIAAVLLWAERPDLYARAGFVHGDTDDCLLLQEPIADDVAVRAATVADHDALWRLHQLSPLGVRRDRRTMSCLLSTPGMWTFVRERDGVPVAYACCGKGADLQNWWHEVGGTDADVAELLPVAMRRMQQDAAFLLLPPQRPLLGELLAPWCADRARVDGPMVCALRDVDLGRIWIDGLDSV